jgi:hypothetical protein
VNLQTRVMNILTKPKDEWPVIAAEQTTIQALYSGYVMPLAAIPVICSFLGNSLIGVSVPLLGNYRIGFGQGLTTAIISYALALAGVYIAAFVIQKLAPTFQSEPNLVQAFKLVAYASTATWVAGVLYINPALGLLVILAALYGVYLFYLGVTPLMKTPPDKVIAYMVVAAIVVIVVSLVMGVVTTAITGAFFGMRRLGI